MKYFIRAVKYFIYLLVVLTIVILVLVKTGFANGDIDTMFVDGKQSLWKIAGIMAAFAAIYPRLGYGRRQILMTGSDEEVRPRLKQTMENRDYRLEKELPDGTMCFVKRSPLARLLKSFEDRLTFSRTISGYEVEGLTKDIVRIVSSLEDRTEEE